jgi:hypothetical protein
MAQDNLLGVVSMPKTHARGKNNWDFHLTAIDGSAA